MDLDQYMQRHGIKGKLLELNVPTPTVETAAEAIGTSVNNIIKSLLFLIDGQPVLAIGKGTQKIDRRQLAKHFEIGRKRVKLANAETVLEITGFAVGAVPPFGHRSKLQVIVDKEVLNQDVIYAGGGATDSLLEISSKELVRVTRATIINLQAGMEG